MASAEGIGARLGQDRMATPVATTISGSTAGDVPPPTAAMSRPAGVMLCLLMFCLGYGFSLWLLNLYRGGDQEHYANFWQAVLWAHPSQWGRLQLQYLSSSELMYRYIIGFGAYYNFDRVVYLSLWNALLVSSMTFILIKYRAAPTFCIMLFTNYYIFVLIGPAERLKFAYLLLILGFCFNDIKWRAGLSLLSVFAHNQAIVQFASASLYYLSNNRARIFSSGIKSAAILAVGGVVLAGAGYVIVNSSGDVISQKADFYGGESQGVLEIVQWILILICGMIVFDRRTQFLIGMLPMGLLTALYGGRINVATLAFFCALSLVQRKTAHPLVLAVMGYMSFKTIGFVSNVFATGQGFA